MIAGLLTDCCWATLGPVKLCTESGQLGFLYDSCKLCVLQKCTLLAENLGSKAV